MLQQLSVRLRSLVTRHVTSVHAIRHYQVPMNGLKKGQVVSHKAKTWIITDFSHHTQARSGGHYKVELRDLLSNVKLVERLQPTAILEGIDLVDRKWTFVYADDHDVHLLQPDTFEELAVPLGLLQGGRQTAQFLTQDMEITVRSHEETPLMVVPPKEAVFEVQSCVSIHSPNTMGENKGTLFKQAELSNGATVLVPDFIKVGEQVLVNLVENKYVGRAK